MRRLLTFAVLAIGLSCRAMEPLPTALIDEQVVYRIEVLQVTDIAPYQESLDGFMMFPAVRRIGMVHTDDENGVAHVQVATAKAAVAGIGVASRQVSKNDAIVPALKELFGDGDGVQMFAVPLDTYYGLRNYEPARDLADFAAENRVPVVSFAMTRMPGAALYVGSDFATVGALSGQQAVKILKRHVKPDILPILRQEEPMVRIDSGRMEVLSSR